MFKKLIVFASGTKDGGGSGFEKLCQYMAGTITAVVSNHRRGGVYEKAVKYNIPFIHFPKNGTVTDYRKIISVMAPDFIALSGWLKLVEGLDPKTTFNIHPGPLPDFGGPGMYGHHVHEAVIAAYKRGEVTHSAVSMHFVTENYDEGPVFFSCKVPINSDDTPETLGKRVNAYEHEWQAKITEKVLRGEIRWDGINPKSLIGAIHM